MPQSFRTTEMSVDSDVASRLLEVARECDVYDSKAEAQADSWERLLTLLCDRLQATPGPLRADVGAKYDTGGK